MLEKILETQRTCKELYDTHDWLIEICNGWVLIYYDKFMEMFTDFYGEIYNEHVYLEAEIDGVIFKAIEMVDKCKGSYDV